MIAGLPKVHSFQVYLLVEFSVCLLFKLFPERVGLHHHVGVEGLGVGLPDNTTLAMRRATGVGQGELAKGQKKSIIKTLEWLP